MTPGTPSGSSTSTAAASYVYAVTRELDPGALAGVHGIGGGPVRLVEAIDAAGPAGAPEPAPLQAVVGDVDPGEFSADAIAAHRDDLAWLGATARAHHGVVGAVGAQRPVVPLALATVYHGDDRVRAAIAERSELFVAALDRVSGRSEWGVKAFVRPRPAAGAEPVRAASGRDYLRARRAALREGESAADAATRAGEELHEALSRRALDSCRHRLQDAALSGRTETMVLNGAYLVDDSTGSDGPRMVRDVVEAWADDVRVTVELTGPWVPYSFTSAPPTAGGSS